MSTTTTTSTHQTVIGEWRDNPANDATDVPFQALARGDKNGVLKLKGIPTFKDPYAKRQWIREHMAAAFRFFGKQGYGEGVSGHISVRGKMFSFKVDIPLLTYRRPYPTRALLDEPLCDALLSHQGFRFGFGRRTRLGYRGR